MLSHYKKAKKEGWQSDQYTAKIIFKDKGQQFSIDINNIDWFSLIEKGVKYSRFNITNEWHIYKDNKEIDSFEYYKFFDEVNRLRDMYDIKKEQM